MWKVKETNIFLQETEFCLAQGCEQRAKIFLRTTFGRVASRWTSRMHLKGRWSLSSCSVSLWKFMSHSRRTCYIMCCALKKWFMANGTKKECDWWIGHYTFWFTALFILLFTLSRHETTMMPTKRSRDPTSTSHELLKGMKHPNFMIKRHRGGNFLNDHLKKNNILSPKAKIHNVVQTVYVVFWSFILFHCFIIKYRGCSPGLQDEK